MPVAFLPLLKIEVLYSFTAVNNIMTNTATLEEKVNEIKAEMNSFTTFLLKNVKWNPSYYRDEKSKRRVNRRLSLVIDIQEGGFYSCIMRTEDYGQIIFKYDSHP